LQVVALAGSGIAPDLSNPVRRGQLDEQSIARLGRGAALAGGGARRQRHRS
jgi:hypothetical protein